MRDKVAKQLRSDKHGFDNRKYCQFFIQIRRVRIWFLLSNYKQCSNNFDAFESALSQMGVDESGEGQNFNFESLPNYLQLQFCYYKGRYNLYNNQYREARTNLRMAYTIYIQNQAFFEKDS